MRSGGVILLDFIKCRFQENVDIIIRVEIFIEGNHQTLRFQLLFLKGQANLLLRLTRDQKEEWH